MSDALPGWRCTWHWSPTRVCPGPRQPASQSFSTEADARDRENTV